MNTFEQHGYPVPPGTQDRLGWGVFISYLGVFRSGGDFLWEQKSKTFCVHIIQKGNGIFRRDGRKFEAGTATAFTFFPGDHIVYNDFPESPWEYVWLRLEGGNTEKALCSAGITRNSPLCRIRNPGALGTLLKKIAGSYSEGEFPALYPMTAACKCLDLLSGMLSGRKKNPGGKSISDSFISIIENRMEPVPSVLEVANAMKIDRTTLFRAFVREHGISPKRHIENIRLEKASKLLSETRMSVKEISAACGFAQAGHFGKFFRERTGKSPTEWRSAF